MCKEINLLLIPSNRFFPVLRLKRVKGSVDVLKRLGKI